MKLVREWCSSITKTVELCRKSGVSARWCSASSILEWQGWMPVQLAACSRVGTGQFCHCYALSSFTLQSGACPDLSLSLSDLHHQLRWPPAWSVCVRHHTATAVSRSLLWCVASRGGSNGVPGWGGRGGTPQSEGPPLFPKRNFCRV